MTLVGLDQSKRYGNILIDLIAKIREVEVQDKIEGMNGELLKLGYSIEEIKHVYHLVLE